MTIEQKIIWLAWYRYEDCSELFEMIDFKMFPKHGALYEKIKNMIDYDEESLNKVLLELKELGILELQDTWVPIHPKKLRDELIKEWKKERGNIVLNDAYKAINSGKDYKKILKEFDCIETEYEKKQSSLKDLFENIANDYAQGKSKGIATEIDELDRVTKQLQKGHLWIIAGSTNTGKTTLTLQIVKRAIMKNVKVEFISLEMSSQQLIERILWLHSAEKKISFEKSIEELIEKKFVVTENIRTVEKLRSHLENTTSELIVLDYIQLVRGGTSYYDEATLTANTLQEMAIKKMIPIIALSQVTKESYKNKESHVMDFKGSGAIAESADVALEIYRDKGENAPLISDVNLFLKKNRHGPTGFKIPGISFNTEKGYFMF